MVCRKGLHDGPRFHSTLTPSPRSLICLPMVELPSGFLHGDFDPGRRSGKSHPALAHRVSIPPRMMIPGHTKRSMCKIECVKNRPCSRLLGGNPVAVAMRLPLIGTQGLMDARGIPMRLIENKSSTFQLASVETKHSGPICSASAGGCFVSHPASHLPS